MSFEISKWYKNYQAPAVLMIDDLSDAYIDKYPQSYKNDWGYLCEVEGSAYDFLKNNLLNKFPDIKITFFVPYLKHNVINDHTKEDYKKFDIGERELFTQFLRQLETYGHEIAHHGSNHGEYINKENLSTVNNFKHEWERFETVDEGVKITVKGMEIFKKYLQHPINGGKFCGYKKRANSLEIIDQSQFHYWCDDVNFNHKNYDYTLFGEHKVISFPTNFAGNAFVRLSYITGNKKKDRQKKITQYLQPIYNVLEYKHLNELYKQGYIISVQEHISPSTSSGMVQSTNIITDIRSLNKIYDFLSSKSIWYATCQEIADYIYTKDNCSLTFYANHLIIYFNNYKKLSNTILSIYSDRAFTLSSSQTDTMVAQKNNHQFVVNIHVQHGKNEFMVNKEL